MKPMVLIHGYSSESPTPDPTSIADIYGDLPRRLRESYDVVEVDLSRYVSLTIADIARAFNRALREQHPGLAVKEMSFTANFAPRALVRFRTSIMGSQSSLFENLSGKDN